MWKWAKQKGLCFICGEPMDPEPYVKYRNPLGWNRDHLYPRHLGGANLASNIVLTHCKCNSRKGHELPTDAEREKFFRVFGMTAWKPND
jgi:5-methylcytosine-specific restriction endonuclease McrA